MPQDRAKKLSALIARLRARMRGSEPRAAGPAPEGHDAVLREFVRAFLAWECTLPRAEAALRRIDEATVDLNDFRVMLPEEMVELFGTSYPRAAERALRLKQALHGLYRHEHRLRLAHLSERGKRESRAFLESLGTQPPVNGAGQPAPAPVVPPYVAARVLLVALGGHAFPLDERLRDMLVQAGVLDEHVPLDEACAWLERTLRAGELGEAYHLLQAWADEGQTPVVKARRAPAKRGSPARGTRPTAAKRSPVPRGARGARGKGVR